MKGTLFSAPQHIQFTTHYFDFESKKTVRKQVETKRSAEDKQKNVLRMKAKYKAKALL